MHIHCLVFCSDDVTEIYPLSRIEQEVRDQKDMFGSLDLHETYYKVCEPYITVCIMHSTCMYMQHIAKLIRCIPTTVLKVLLSMVETYC